MRLLIKDAALSEAVSRPQPSLFGAADELAVRVDPAALDLLKLALLYEVDGCGRLTLREDPSIRLLDDLWEEGISHTVLLLVVEPIEESDGIQKSTVFGVVLHGILLQDPVEGAAVGAPYAHVLQCLHSGSPGTVVQQGETPEGVAPPHGVADIAVDYDLQRPCMGDKERRASLALLCHELGLPKFEVLHCFQDGLELRVLEEGADSVLFHPGLDQFPCGGALVPTF
mmetsp:Transcript_2780/g.6513  ORF Transcript_2780/g.6513 Transcript_2780/m.6513 type:complete len:227 (+) Transcript_2780:2032-2712(+)